jgi:hypothetical protein
MTYSHGAFHAYPKTESSFRESGGLAPHLLCEHSVVHLSFCFPHLIMFVVRADGRDHL